MISFEDLKKIEQSPYVEEFRKGVAALGTRLYGLNSNGELGRGEFAVSEEDENRLDGFRNSLWKLASGTEDEQRNALENLKDFPAFLKKKAVANRANSPTMLDHLLALEKSRPRATVTTLTDDLRVASRLLELDLGLSKKVMEEKQTLNRSMWEKPAAPTIPTRDQAKRGTWAALFHSLTKPSTRVNDIPDVSVYEHKCSENTMRRLAAAQQIMKGNANQDAADKRVLEVETAALRKNPIVRMTMRNERTVEQLRRGSISDVAERINQTRNEFSFRNKDELEDAKTRTRHILKKMKAMVGKAASSAEFTALKQAMEKFNETEWGSSKQPQCSAELLEAVENFTKGRKNVQRSERAQECVNLALDALTAAVPNAAANPHVTPLIKRFNEVRSRRNRISLDSFGAARTNNLEAVKKQYGKYEDLAQEVLDTMGTLHDGKLDPVQCNKVVDMLTDREDFAALRSAFSTGEEKERKAVVALAEDMAANPDTFNSVKNMNKRELENAVQAKMEQQSQMGMQVQAGLQ